MAVIVGLVVLLNQDSYRFVDRSSRDAVAESFMQAWIAGDGEAAAEMFTDIGRFDAAVPGMIPEGLEPEDLPALNDWYRAMGWEFEGRGCGALRYTFVSCAYRYENKLTRAVGAEPVTGSFFLTIDSEGIRSVRNEFGYYEGWDMFIDWASSNYPDDLELMFDGSFALLDRTSLKLWESHTDEFYDEFVDSPDALAEWKLKVVSGSWLPDGYFAAVTRICSAANARFEEEVGVLFGKDVWTLEDQAAFHEAAARFSEESLVDLRALPAPDTDTARLEEVFSIMEQQTEVLGQIVTAATDGDAALVEKLSRDRVDLTHAKDGVGGEEFWYCPVGLPA